MRNWLFPLLAVLGALLASAIILPLVIPIPPAAGTRPPRQLAGQDSRFIGVDALEVHFQQAGSGGTPLILLHGFAASVFTWRNVLQPLGEEQLVVAFDRPGFGLTERPMPPFSGSNPYSQITQAELTIRLMDELGLDRAVLVGSSAGGTIALLTALEHPERVEALVLVDPAVYFSPGAPGWVRPFLALPQVRRVGPLLVRSIRDWGFKLLSIAWHDPSKVTSEVISGYIYPLQAENWDRALWELTLATQELDLASRLDELQMPVLVVTGDDDRIVPPQLSIRLAGEIPEAELVVIPECGHVPQEECPQEFLQAVEDFLGGLGE